MDAANTNSATLAYNLFFAQATLFENLISELRKTSADQWRVDALQAEANRLKQAFEATASAIAKANGITFNKSAQAAQGDGRLAPMEQAGTALRTMRSQYATLKQVQVSNTTYRERVVSVPRWQTIAFWFVIAVFGWLILQFLLLPVGFFVNRVLVYRTATQAEANGEWQPAIEGFTYTYTTGPYQDSAIRLLNSYTQAVQTAFSAEDWDLARQYGTALLELDIADSTAQGWIRDSYYRPAIDEFLAGDYAAVRALLDNLPSPLDAQAEVLYKRSLFGEADDLANDSSPDWDEIERLMLVLAARPEVGTTESTQIEQAGRELLSVSYTSRARELIRTADYEAARIMLEPARTVPLLTVSNNAVANGLHFESYYAAGSALIAANDYEAAREQFTILLAEPGLTDDYEQRGNVQLRLTYYLPGLAALEAEDYETARTNFATLIELDAPQPPYEDTLTNYYAAFYRPAVALLEPVDEDTAPNYEAARALFEEMLAVASDGIDYLDTSSKYYDTFYRPALALLQPADADTIPDYEAAKVLFEQMLAADEDSIDYLRTRDLYFSTYYYPALALLEGDVENEIQPNYEAARALLLFIIEFDDTSETYLATLDSYYATFYRPAVALLQPVDSETQPDYEAAGLVFAAMFEADERSRDYLDAQSRYWDTIYIPALEFFVADDFLAARTGFAVIIADEGGNTHKATERFYLNTYFLRGMDFLNGNELREVAVDYEQARAEFAFIRDYLSENPAVEYARPVDDRYADTYFKPGVATFENADYEAARELFAEIITLMDDDADLSIELQNATIDYYQRTYLVPATIALDEGRYDDARLPLIELLEFKRVTLPAREETQQRIVRSYTEPAESAIAEERYEDARALLETLYTEHNQSEATINLLVNVYDFLIREAIDSESFEVARAYLERLREVKPDYASSNAELLYDFYYSQGASELANGNWDSARDLFEQLAGINPVYRDAPTLLLETYYSPAQTAYSDGLAQGNAVLCRTARDELESMLEDYPAASAYRDTNSLINSTYICEIDIAISGNAMDTARDLIVELHERSPFYSGIESRFIVSYYEPALTAFNAGDYQQARTILDEFVTQNDTFFYEDAFILLRDAYYVPATAALQAAEWDTARREFVQLLAIDANYKDAPALYRSSFMLPAENAFNSQDWDTVRTEINLLRQRIDNNDSEALGILYESYYVPAQQAFAVGDWAEVQNQLHGLQANEPDYKVEDTLTWLLDSYYLPATANYQAEAWSDARRQLQALEAEIANLRRLSAANPALADALTARNLLEADTHYNDALTMYHDTYYIPGVVALTDDVQNWQAARNELGALVIDEEQPDYTNPTYSELPAAELFISAFLTVGEGAIADGNWTFARDNLRPIITEYVDFATDDQSAAAHNAFIASYETPAGQAETNQDWATARTIWQQYLDTETETLELTEADISAIQVKITATYTRPVEIAIENEAYETARQALQFALAEAAVSDTEYQLMLRQTYEVPLTTAIELGDWFSAAELYVELRDIVAVDDEQLQATFTGNPELQLALANRYQGDWAALPLTAVSDISTKAPIFDIAFNVTGTQFATVSLNGYLEIRSTTGDDAALTVVMPSGWLTEVEWEPTQGAWLATASSEHQIDIWNAHTGQLIAALRDNNSRITALTISADGSRLIAGNEAGQVLVWQTSDWSAAPQQYLADNTMAVTAVTVAPEGGSLAIALANNTVLLLDAASGTQQSQITADTYIADVLFTPDGSSIITLGHANLARWALDGNPIQSVASADWLRGGTFLSNQQLFVTLDASGTVVVWDTTDWQSLTEGQLESEASAIGFAPDSRNLVISGLDGQLFIVTAQTATYLSQGD